LRPNLVIVAATPGDVLAPGVPAAQFLHGAKVPQADLVASSPTATAQGFGFGASEPVTLYWGNPQQLLGTALANAGGSFTGQNAFTFTVPANAPPGINGVAAFGQITGAIAVGVVEVK